MKKLILVILSVIFTLGMVEIGLIIFRGRPAAVNMDESLETYYIDIYDPIFRKDKKKGIFLQRRFGPKKPAQLAMKKTASEKRVFIIGESVADGFEEKIIADKLKEILPAYKWKIVNCGRGGHDSYNMWVTAKKIPRYKPDLVILMMGHNDGVREFVKINHWIYKYKILASLWVTRILSEYFNPPKKVEGKETDAYFEYNLRRMCKIFQKKRIPFAVCTLPLNQMAAPQEFGYEKEDYFKIWWLFHKKEYKKLIDIMERYPGRYENQDCYLYLLKSYEILEKNELADKIHSKIEIKNSRNDIIRQTIKNRRGVILVDFQKRLRELSNGKAGFDFFYDHIHYWYPGYKIVADEIIESIYKYNRNNNTEMFDVLSNWSYEEFKRSEFQAIIKENQALLHESIDYLFKEQRFLFSIIFENKLLKRIDVVIDILKYWYHVNPRMIISFKDKIISLSKEIEMPEGVNNNWGKVMCLVGEALRETRDFEVALDYFQEAIVKNKGDYYSYLFRGLCYYDVNKMNLAEKDFIKLRKVNLRFNWLSIEYLNSLLRQG